MRRLHRIGQYLHTHKRMVWRFDWQDPSSVLDAYGDAYWTACQRTTKKHKHAGSSGEQLISRATQWGETDLDTLPVFSYQYVYKAPGGHDVD